MRSHGLVCNLVLVVCFKLIDCTQVLRPRGVPLSKKVFYDPKKGFNCLDGSGSLPFLFVNDDYCDCDDGSDEPGTAACPNGIFHCPNVGYFEKDIPSSRVNDGICDCCDSSDEYNSTAGCLNNCMELGQKAAEEEQRQRVLMEEGYKIRDVYIKEALQKKAENKAKLEQLRKELVEVEAIKNQKDAIKKGAEEKEKAALEKYKSEQDLKKNQREEEDIRKAQEEDQRLAERAFNELDHNKDNLISYQELQQFPKFDQNADGIVSDDEAKFFLHMKSEMELDEFVSTGWVIMKPYYLKDKKPEPEPEIEPETEPESEPEKEIEEHETEQHEPVTESPDYHEPDLDIPPTVPEPNLEEPIDKHEDGLLDEDDEDDDESYTTPFYQPNKEDPDTFTSDTKPDYDEDTRQIVEVAKKAKQEYSEAEGTFLDHQNKIREIEVLLESDYGPDDAFMALNGQCFDFHDREYIYKVCPFDKASQRQKDGGSEVNLGRWGHWSGPEHNKYERMKYDGGATCWNGPARSVEVHLRCGLSNQLLSASEPSRCEYKYDFETPALCVTTPRGSHDEL